MISRLLQILALAAASFASAEDGESQSLQDLRNELAEYDSIKVSELLFPGCTAPVSRGFEINFEQKTFTIFSESAFGRRADSVVDLFLTQEEIEDINSSILSHFASAESEKSINEKLMEADATKDLEAMKQLKSEHPLPIGGHPSLLIEIQIQRSDQSFSYASQFGESGSWKAFTNWISSLHERAAQTERANQPEQQGPATR